MTGEALTAGRGVVVVVPTKEERTNLPRATAGIRSVLPWARILVVDDESTDGTGAIADRLAKLDPRIHVLHRQGRPGLGPAYCAGFTEVLRWNDVDRVIQMDADLSHRPGDLPRLLAASEVGLVLGSRYVDGGGVEGWAAHRRWLSVGGNAYARRVLPELAHLQDLTGGLKCWHPSALTVTQLQQIQSRGYAFQVEMTLAAVRAGIEVVEVPIRFPDRITGASKLDLRICGEAARSLWRLR